MMDDAEPSPLSGNLFGIDLNGNGHSFAVAGFGHVGVKADGTYNTNVPGGPSGVGASARARFDDSFRWNGWSRNTSLYVESYGQRNTLDMGQIQFLDNSGNFLRDVTLTDGAGDALGSQPAASPEAATSVLFGTGLIVVTILTSRIRKTHARPPISGLVWPHHRWDRRGRDVLHLRYSEQTACFMVWLKWPIGGPSSILARSGNLLKTIDATHPNSGLIFPQVRLWLHGRGGDWRRCRVWGRPRRPAPR
jgi:hypothetical protein